MLLAEIIGSELLDLPFPIPSDRWETSNLLYSDTKSNFYLLKRTLTNIMTKHVIQTIRKFVNMTFHFSAMLNKRIVQT